MRHKCPLSSSLPVCHVICTVASRCPMPLAMVWNHIYHGPGVYCTSNVSQARYAGAEPLARAWETAFLFVLFADYAFASAARRFFVSTTSKVQRTLGDDFIPPPPPPPPPPSPRLMLSTITDFFSTASRSRSHSRHCFASRFRSRAGDERPSCLNPRRFK